MWNLEHNLENLYRAINYNAKRLRRARHTLQIQQQQLSQLTPTEIKQKENRQKSLDTTVQKPPSSSTSDLSIESGKCSLESEQQQKTLLFYQKYSLDDNIPIEIIVQICLLMNNVREIIQIDKYVYSDTQWEIIQQWITCSPYFTNKIDNPDKILTYVFKNKGAKLTDIIVIKSQNHVILDFLQKGELDKAIEQYLDLSFYGLCKFDIYTADLFSSRSISKAWARKRLS